MSSRDDSTTDKTLHIYSKQHSAQELPELSNTADEKENNRKSEHATGVVFHSVLYVTQKLFTFMMLVADIV